jgi:hypothetical protein
MRATLTIAALLLAFGSVQACTCDNSAVGGDMLGGGGDLAGADLAMPDAFILPDGGVLVNDGGRVCFIAPCQGHIYQCGDCQDNDGDGLVDSDDPNCLGPCSNNEQGLSGNIPGQNNAPCKMDCYWDQDTGSGNDDCFWDHACDTFEQGPPVSTNPEIGCNYDPNTKFPGGDKCMDKFNTQSQTCHDVCGPLTPNGCDCFGCCEDPNRPGNFIFAGSTNAADVGTCAADPATMADPTKCKPCTPVAGCANGCGHCELCFGKTMLPPDCFPDGGVQDDGGIIVGQCMPGVQPCGLPGQAVCPSGFYCITGCCQMIIP